MEYREGREDEEKMKRPYELERPQYALWFDVGERLGSKTQSQVAVALCGGSHEIFESSLIQGEAEILRELASFRGVLLFFR